MWHISDVDIHDQATPLTDIPAVNFITTCCDTKLILNDLLSNLAVKPGYLDKLDDIIRHYADISEKHVLSGKDKQLALVYPHVIMVRVVTNFPELTSGMNWFYVSLCEYERLCNMGLEITSDIKEEHASRFLDGVTYENILKAEGHLKRIAEAVFIHELSPVLIVYYLLAEASFYSRRGQINYNMQKVQSAKQDFFNAAFSLEHTLLKLNTTVDVNTIEPDLLEFQNVLMMIQKHLYK